MTQLIRVEHKDGIGMFRGWKGSKFRVYNVKDSLPNIYDRHYDFPVPRLDGLKLTRNRYCAYISVKQLKKWIKPKEFKKLFELGYKVWLLEVEECQIGTYQAIYRKKDVISKTDISNLFL